MDSLKIRRAVLLLPVATMVLAICLGSLLPTFTDEVGWRFQERAALDGVDKLFADICGPATLATPPWFMWPVRAYSAVFNVLFPDPLFVRMSGVLYALALLALVWVLIERLFNGSVAKSAVRAIAFGLLSLGMLPLLLVWSRPEQPILLSLLGSSILSSRAWAGPGRAGGKSLYMVIGAIVALSTIAVSYHAKGVFLAPLYILCALTCAKGPGTVIPRIAGCAIMAALALWAAVYWSERMACPGDPEIAAGNSKLNIATQIVSGNLSAEVMAKLASNANILRYPLITAPNETPIANWITPHALSNELATRFRISLALLWAAILIFTIGCLLRGAWLVRQRPEGLPPLLLAASILVLQFAWAAMQEVKNTYEATSVVPLLIVCLALSLHAARPGPRFSKALGSAAAVLALVSLGSLAFVTSTYLPSLRDSLTRTGYLPYGGGSQSLANYSTTRREIMAAAARCNIDPDARNAGLLVDDVTYFAFMESYRPHHVLGVSQIERPVEYLTGLQSAGGVLTCYRVPPGLVSRARRTGRYCCLPKF